MFGYARNPQEPQPTKLPSDPSAHTLLCVLHDYDNHINAMLYRPLEVYPMGFSPGSVYAILRNAREAERHDPTPADYPSRPGT